MSYVPPTKEELRRTFPGAPDAHIDLIHDLNAVLAAHGGSSETAMYCFAWATGLAAAVVGWTPEQTADHARKLLEDVRAAQRSGEHG
jgi:hypothetical protein